MGRTGAPPQAKKEATCSHVVTSTCCTYKRSIENHWEPGENSVKKQSQEGVQGDDEWATGFRPVSRYQSPADCAEEAGNAYRSPQCILPQPAMNFHGHRMPSLKAQTGFRKMNPKILPQPARGITDRRTDVVTIDTSSTQPVIHLTRFSRHNRLLRVCTYVLRFINRPRKRITIKSALTADDLVHQDVWLQQEDEAEDLPSELALLKSSNAKKAAQTEDPLDQLQQDILHKEPQFVKLPMVDSSYHADVHAATLHNVSKTIWIVDATTTSRHLRAGQHTPGIGRDDKTRWQSLPSMAASSNQEASPGQRQRGSESKGDDCEGHLLLS